MMHALGSIFKPEDKPLKVERDKCSFSCCLIWSFKTFVRLICFIMGCAQTAMGAYIFYTLSTTKDHAVKNYLALAVTGFYGVLTGVIIIFSETRTRWTRKAVKVFIFLCTGLARGLVYILFGAINTPIKMDLKIGTFDRIPVLIGMGVVAGGILSIIEFCLTYRRNRHRLNDAIAKNQEETKKTQLYDLFEKEDAHGNKIPPNTKEKDPHFQDLEMQPIEEA
ncbi:hypothetical protein CYY_007635 [Polysphondylium violaceum]|uniref:Transmembrane protein n=1 Tax=Polysphondylium violaceum TaxID=133409 RepID=A0A8J4PND2_9MYCE|nr:hypothetical protein CYY_007635 [Polysphondylium violaceum]